MGVSSWFRLPARLCVRRFSVRPIHKLPKNGKWQHSGRFDLSKTRRFPQEHGRITEYVLRMVGGNGEVREAGIGPLSSLPCNHLSGVVGRWSVVDGEIINDQ